MKALFNMPSRLVHWIAGSIRRKLTFFVVMLCLILIAIVWLLGVQMLEPAYKSTIRNNLSNNLDTVVSVLDTAAAEGESVIETLYEDQNVRFFRLSSVVKDRLDSKIYSGELVISNFCIDMSELTNHGVRPVFVLDNLPGDCPLHQKSTAFNETENRSASIQGTELLEHVRDDVYNKGMVFYEADQQMVMGKLTGDGSVAVVVATNLDSIPEALGVIRQLMMYISGILLLVSTLGAFFFSLWFTEPLTKLSKATKEISGGNYDVNVVPSSSDEIGELTRDFNQMVKEVKRSSELQRDLIANVSHDLRTPLTLIKGYAETVRDLTGDDPRKREEQLSVIVDETDRLTALVGSVMEFSRISSGHEKPHAVRFDLAQLCDELAYRYELVAKKRGYNFVFEGDEPCEIQADPMLVERALRNMLDNAMNHAGEDMYVGLEVKPTGKGSVRVEVKDHGKGIAPEDLPYLFDRYYRSRADAGKTGTGLGLSITKAIFGASGFDYGVESKPGEGATFWFEAPLA